MTIDLHEALRYLGTPPAPALLEELQALSEFLTGQIHPRWTWRAFPKADFPLPGQTAERMLREADTVILLVVTLGASFDALLRRTQARDVRRAVLLDALGSAYVESACDEAAIEVQIRFPEKFLTDRFSPGYGDLPLDVQPRLLDAADAMRVVGVTLTPSLLMLPQKSVTALIGVANMPQPARVRGCAYCALHTTCTYRKAGSCHV